MIWPLHTAYEGGYFHSKKKRLFLPYCPGSYFIYFPLGKVEYTLVGFFEICVVSFLLQAFVSLKFVADGCQGGY